MAPIPDSRHMAVSSEVSAISGDVAPYPKKHSPRLVPGTTTIVFG